MKKLLPILALAALTGTARAATVSGVVTSGATCAPVAGQKVYVSDSMMTWKDSAVTNSSGAYSITVPSSVGTTWLQAWANACGNQSRSRWTPYSGANITMNIITCGTPQTLSGQVYVGTTPTSGPAKVWLIRRDVNPSTLDTSLVAIDSMQTTGAGFYRFEYACVPSGVLLMKAALLPSHPNYSAYLPTYFDSSLNWNGATTITPAYFGASPTYIHMRAGTNAGGPGFIGGSVLLGANKSAGVGDPLNGRTLILTKANGQAVAMTTSDATGKFQFPSLANGTYKLFGDAWGKYNPALTVTISSTQQTVTNIIFEENNKKFEGKFGNVGVGRINGLTGLSVFPNPATDHVTINGLTAINGEKEIILSNVTGNVVVRQTINGNTSINTADLPSGIYLLQVRAASGNASFQIVK